ncbi:MAG: hypothetical protein TU36_006965 [Vulcanisaeta sp. AZ3]
MSRPKERKKSQRRRGRFFYIALILVIFGEAVFIAVQFLPGIINRATISNIQPVELNATIINRYMLSTLINPYNMSMINPMTLGLVNNTRPLAMYLIVNDPYLIHDTCSVWPLLYNASIYRNYKVIVVVFPEPVTQAPASSSAIQQFDNYVYELCDGFNLESTNFLITTALWNNLTSTQGIIVGYGALLPEMLTELGINASRVYFPIIILIGPHNNVTSVIYGPQLNNSTYLKELLSLNTRT